MAQTLQSRVKKSIKFISSLLLFWFITGNGYAQSTLLPGDLMVVTINSSDASIEIVPLIDLDAGTIFELKNDIESEPGAQITLQQPVLAGNSVFINGEGSQYISVDGELGLEKNQLFLFQPDFGINRFLFAAEWGDQSIATNTNEIPKAVPFIRLGEEDNHQYYLKNGASGTVSMIKKMVADPSNWTSSEDSFTRFRTSFRVLSSPVILFDQNISNIMEGDSIPLSVAIYEHDGSKLTVDVVFNESYSTADSNDVSKFKSYRYNFTGLIGDAVYEIRVPLYDDDTFEDRETGYFELRNLSGGNFGDFVSHAAFIQDNEIPNVLIASIFKSGTGSGDYIELQNNERVYVSISGWSMETESQKIQLGDAIELAPFETRRLFVQDFVFNDGEERLFEKDDREIRVKDGFGNEINSFIIESKLKESLEISKLKQEIPDSPDFDTNSSISIADPQPRNTEIEPKKEKHIPGWYPSNIDDFQDNLSNSIFWNEKSSSFKLVTLEKADSLDGQAIFTYLDFEAKESDDFQPVVADTLTPVNVVDGSDLSVWNLTLSATDADENGIINDSEGYNFVEYAGSDSVSVADFVTILEENIGTGFVYPTIFSAIENGVLSSKRGLQVLSPGEFIWIKIDSLFEPQRFSLGSGVVVQEPYFSTEDIDPISNFQLSLSSDSSSDILDFNFYDDAVFKPRNLLEPSLDLRIDLKENQEPIFGGYFLNNWNSELQLTHSGQLSYSFPLGVLYDQNEEFSLNVSEWNMEAGWRLFIEDEYTLENTELIPGLDFSFQYLAEQSIDVEEDYQQDIFSRYTLFLTSPEYVETVFDQPEQIELNQNFPNPFNPATIISFYLPETVEVKLSVFNVVGQPISVLEEGILISGEHEYEWNASGYPSGMYIYQLEVGNKVMTRKMTLVK